MVKTIGQRIAEYQNDIQRYEQNGKVLYDFSWSRIANLQIPIDELTLHYGMEYVKAMMKLKTLLDDKHSEKDIEHRLEQIDSDIRYIEEAMKHDLIIEAYCCVLKKQEFDMISISLQTK